MLCILISSEVEFLRKILLKLSTSSVRRSVSAPSLPEKRSSGLFMTFSIFDKNRAARIVTIANMARRLCSK